MIDTLYREEILEHYKDPLNYGRLKSFDVSSKQTNPFCGDDIEMFIKFKRGQVFDIGFVGKGCAISIAASSLLTNYAKGKKKKQLTEFSEQDMLELLGIRVSEIRKKCALLAFSVVKDCCLYGKV